MHLVADVIEDELHGISTAVGQFNGRPCLVKRATTTMEAAFLANEARLLAHLRGSGFTPVVYDHYMEPDGAWVLVEQYLGESEWVADEVTFRRNCAYLLLRMKEAGVVHGDLTSKNIIVRDKFPWVVDWHQARLTHEPGPDKRQEGDAHHLWQAAIELSPDTSRHLRKWAAIRPFVADGTVLDLGCAEGDYLLFAMAENPNRDLVGVDKHPESIYSAADVLNAGTNLLRDDTVKTSTWEVWCKDAFNWLEVRSLDEFHTAFLMSVYPYIAQHHGRVHADLLVFRAIQQSSQLFFETQLHGDGPGVPWHRTDDEVAEWLAQWGTPQPLVTIPVHGRDAARTVWRVT